MTPEEKMVWAAAFAAEMQYSGRPGKALWSAYMAVKALRVADEFSGDYERKMSPEELELSEAKQMLEEMRGGK